MNDSDAKPRSGHGGPRPGAGGKPRLVNPRGKMFILEERQAVLLRDWAARRGLNQSQAIRALIEEVLGT